MELEVKQLLAEQTKAANNFVHLLSTQQSPDMIAEAYQIYLQFDARLQTTVIPKLIYHQKLAQEMQALEKELHDYNQEMENDARKLMQIDHKLEVLIKDSDIYKHPVSKTHKTYDFNIEEVMQLSFKLRNGSCLTYINNLRPEIERIQDSAAVGMEVIAKSILHLTTNELSNEFLDVISDPKIDKKDDDEDMDEDVDEENEVEEAHVFTLEGFF